MRNKEEILEDFTRMGEQIDKEHAPDPMLSAEIHELIFAIRQMLTLKVEWILQPNRQEEIDLQIIEVELFICERRGKIKLLLKNYHGDQKAGIEDDVEWIILNAKNARDEIEKHALQLSDDDPSEWESSMILEEPTPEVKAAKPGRKKLIVLSHPLPGTTPDERKGQITPLEKPVNGRRTVHTPATATPSKSTSTLQQGSEKMSQGADQNARRSIS